jgi:hypothetical protein
LIRPAARSTPEAVEAVRKSVAFGLLSLLMTAACSRTAPRSGRSFPEIRDLVTGKTAAQVEALLGPPDTRQPALLDSERWIWWNYTFLDGDEYAPERRGQVVHLEIGFDPPADQGGLVATVREGRPPYDEWRISELLGITYAIPRNVPERRNREEP